MSPKNLTKEIKIHKLWLFDETKLEKDSYFLVSGYVSKIVFSIEIWFDHEDKSQDNF